MSAPPIAEADGWLRDQDTSTSLPLLDLAQGVPSFAPAEALREHVSKVALDPGSARYTAILGLAALRDALAAHLSEVYGAPVERAQVAITAGCNQAFCTVMQTLASPGDEVILTCPYYFNHHMWLQMQGIEPVLLGCDADSGLPDPDAAESLLGQRTKAVVLVSPNNPTGAIYPPSLLEAFHALAARHDIALVLDETYKDFLPGRTRPHAIFEAPRWARHLVALHSFSKSYALTGYRVGAIVAAPAVLCEVEKVLDCVTICPSALSQRAALFALENLDGWRDERTRELVRRADALREAFAHPGLGYRLMSAGGFFAYVRHPFEGVAATDVAKRLAAEHNVLCLPGSMFGPGQEAFLRLSFTNVDDGCFADLVERLLASQR